MHYYQIKTIIDQWDPIGLIRIDPNHDHYNPEISRIIELLETNQYNNPQDFALRIEQVFIDLFDEETYSRPIEECLEVAKAILAKKIE